MMKQANYDEVIAGYWNTIRQAWREHRHKRPILECNLAAEQVRVYPAMEYINGLTERTREATRQEYEETVAAGGMMIFVLDDERKVLQSHCYFPESERQQRRPNQTPQETRKKASRLCARGIRRGKR